MSKEEAIEVEGIVAKALSNAQFSVVMPNGHNIIAYPAGKSFLSRLFPGMRSPWPYRRMI
jgi:translation initiation factor IF-1